MPMLRGWPVVCVFFLGSMRVRRGVTDWSVLSGSSCVPTVDSRLVVKLAQAGVDGLGVEPAVALFLIAGLVERLRVDVGFLSGGGRFASELLRPPRSPDSIHDDDEGGDE